MGKNRLRVDVLVTGKKGLWSLRSFYKGIRNLMAEEKGDEVPGCYALFARTFWLYYVLSSYGNVAVTNIKFFGQNGPGEISHCSSE